MHNGLQNVISVRLSKYKHMNKKLIACNLAYCTRTRTRSKLNTPLSHEILSTPNPILVHHIDAATLQSCNKGTDIPFGMAALAQDRIGPSVILGHLLYLCLPRMTI